MHRPNARRVCVLVCCCTLEFVSPSRGEVLTFDYTGSVVLGGGTVFGFPIGDGVAVAGQLTVDTTAMMTHDFGGGRVGYRQTIPAGLTATFGSGASSVDFVSDEYLVVIGNDVLFGSADSVEFLFTSDLSPPLVSPLEVNGVPRRQGDYNGDGATDPLDHAEWMAQFGMAGGSADGNGNGVVDAADYVIWRAGRPVGFLSVEFLTAFGGNTLFSSSSLSDADLATNLTMANFSSMFNRLGDEADAPDVFFDLTSFQLRSPSASAVPEPCALILFVAGALMALLRLSRRPAGLDRA